jgi:8-oxo-dGTP diphosphatase
MTSTLTSSNKPHLFVSAGILVNEKEEFLLASRPDGKAYAGYWEFPGGKIEAGETAFMALKRELEEEMGITITEAYPWLQQHFDYPHAQVTLFFFQVTRWEGKIIAKEQQEFAWQNITHLTATPILPANSPILRGLALPRVLLMSNVAGLGEALFLERLQQRIEDGLAWLILREPQLDARQFRTLAEKVLALTHRQGTKVIFHRHFTCARQLGADGLHLDTKALMACKSRPRDIEYCGAFIHTQQELNRAAELELDYVILGDIHATPSQPGIGWQGFADLLQHRNQLPVYASGGLTRQDIPQARAKGAQGIALSSNAWEG